MNREMGLVSYPNNNKSMNWFFEESKPITITKWTPEENKMFENALALFDKDTPDRWHNVASMIPGKTVNDVIKQYRELVEDVSDIEAGLIPVPGYGGYNNSFALEWIDSCYGYERLKQLYGNSGVVGHKRGARSCSDHERKKGVPWTEEEHRQFLLGLKKYGKGDWRNISRNFVTSRTPTQVASHAQKYFIRQLSGGKDKRRSSIHDITTVNLGSEDSIKSPSPESKNNHPRSPQKLNSTAKDFDGKNMILSSEQKNPGVVMEFCPLLNSGLMTMSHLQQIGTSINLQGISDPREFNFGHYDTMFQTHRTRGT